MKNNSQKIPCKISCADYTEDMKNKNLIAQLDKTAQRITMNEKKTQFGNIACHAHGLLTGIEGKLTKRERIAITKIGKIILTIA